MAETNEKSAPVKVDPLPSTRMKLPQHSDFDDIVKIEVGEESKRRAFQAHRGVLSFYSGYFKSALGGSWKESESGVIRLDTEDGDVFGRFILWLYTKMTSDETLVVSCKAMVKLWLFADRRNVPLLMNETIDELHRRIADTWVVPTDCLREIYEHTSEESPLRRMVIFTMSRTIHRDLLATKDAVSKWPKEALVEMLRLTTCNPRPLPMSQDQYKALNMCPEYHVHEEGASCKNPSS